MRQAKAYGRIVESQPRRTANLWNLSTAPSMIEFTAVSRRSTDRAVRPELAGITRERVADWPALVQLGRAPALS